MKRNWTLKNKLDLHWNYTNLSKTILSGQINKSKR